MNTIDKNNYVLKKADSKKEVENLNLFFYSVGYESRSKFVRGNLVEPEHCFGLLYPSDGIGSFDNNVNAARSRDDELVESVDANILEAKIQEAVIYRKSHVRKIRVGIDVTCLNRELMVLVIDIVFKNTNSLDEIVFFYTPAEFQEPLLELSPIRKFGIASNRLPGSLRAPSLSRSVIMGLGYEYGAALHVHSIVEPEYVHFLYSTGGDPKYEAATREANFEYKFDFDSYDLSPYPLYDPIALHGILRDLVHSLKFRSSVMIVPFGPKIFSAISIILALHNRQDVTFMRYSVESIDSFEDVHSSGDTVSFVYKSVEK